MPDTIHDSDCALHNAPAYMTGLCDCTQGDHEAYKAAAAKHFGEFARA